MFNGTPGYNLGGVTNTIGQGGSPFDMMTLQSKYIEGSETPNRVIILQGLASENKIADIDNSLYLYDMFCHFETPTLGLRAQNLHRSGATRATPVWCIIQKHNICVQIFQKLFEKSIPTITMHTLAYLAEGTPIITETMIFSNCLITSIDPFNSGYFAVFSFSFTKLDWTQKDYQQSNPNEAAGTYAYTFDFTTAKGSQNAAGGSGTAT